jgi:hypothetical protein
MKSDNETVGSHGEKTKPPLPITMSIGERIQSSTVPQSYN